MINLFHFFGYQIVYLRINTDIIICNYQISYRIFTDKYGYNELDNKQPTT
jgi:hypothetical protein